MVKNKNYKSLILSTGIVLFYNIYDIIPMQQKTIEDIPNEIILIFIEKVAEEYINDWNNILEFEKIKKTLINNIQNIFLTCRQFNQLNMLYIIKKIIYPLKNKRFNKLKQEIIRQSKAEYNKYTKKELNLKLIKIINQINNFNRVSKEDFLEIIKLIFIGANVNSKANHKKTALILAAEKGHKDIVELIINSNANIYAKDLKGFTALSTAIYNGHLDVIKLLINKDTNFIDKYCSLTTEDLNIHIKNILNYDIIYPDDWTKIIKLVSLGADINTKNRFGNTALMRLTPYREYKGISKVFINYKANINSKDMFSRNILMMTIDYNNRNMIKSLINAGIDINIKDDFDINALIYAIDKKSQISTISLLIKSGININDKDKLGRTALILASQQNNEDVVKLLINNKVDINAKDNIGKTALMYAVKYKHTNIVQLLLENKANTNIYDNNNKTALMIAIKKGHHNITKLLEKYNNNDSTKCITN